MIRCMATSLVLSTVLVTSLGGQQLTKAQSTALQESLQAGELTAATRLGDQQCGDLLAASRDHDLKVSQRAERAREAMRCARTIAAAGVALTSPERSPQARALLDAWLATYERNLEEKESENEFLGLRWGVGLGVSRSLDQNVNEAAIVNGVVRQLSDTSEQPRALFEYHKLFWCNDGGKVGTRGCGPFVAVAATDSKVLSGVGFGFLYGWKTAPRDAEGFSIGLGGVLDARVKDLGDDFVLNEAPPASETSVRFITRSRWSVLLFVTRSF